MAKSMVLAVLLSVFLNGIGLMYAGRIGLGLLFFILCLIFGFASIFTLGTTSIISLVIWIINLVLTVQTVNKANGK
ncbi:MAG: hypothetical protein Q4Q53_01880 [Methanocorpusculum sp.]|nr:hypothetical protein [Methanocorpusculum sp.]